MRVFENGTYRDMTPEEIAAMKAEQTKVELMEKSRPLTGEEVTRLVISETINTLPLDDNTALRAIEFYPAWSDMIGKTIEKAGFKVKHGDKLWKTVQPNYTVLAQWEPGAVGTESLFEQINETHTGTQDDPIPYDGNMALTAGLYYHQDWIIYRCIRDTGNPVYHPLSDLVGIYVEVAV